MLRTPPDISLPTTTAPWPAIRDIPIASVTVTTASSLLVHSGVAPSETVALSCVVPPNATLVDDP